MKLTTAVMKSPMGNTVLPIMKLIPVKSGLPAISAMRGLMMSFTSAVTTVPKAAPMTTPTAKSTTLPRRTNCLNPDNIKTSYLEWPLNLNGERGLVKARSTGAWIDMYRRRGLRSIGRPEGGRRYVGSCRCVRCAWASRCSDTCSLRIRRGGVGQRTGHLLIRRLQVSLHRDAHAHLTQRQLPT